MTKKPKLTREQKKIKKIHAKTALMFGVVPTEMLDTLSEEDFVKAEESAEAKAQLHDKVMQIFTIVPTKEEAVEFIKTHILLSHKSHYDRWAELHKYDPNAESTKNIYLNTVVDMKDSKNRYSIIDIKYTYEDLAIVLRMSAGCAPIGCSYENPVEIEAFLAHEAFKKATEQQSAKEVEDSTKKEDPAPAPKKKRGRPKKKEDK